MLWIKEFSAFLLWEDAHGLKEIIPFASHLSYLGPVSGVFTSWVSLGLSVCGVAAVWWLLDSRCYPPSWFPSELSGSHGRLQLSMTVTSFVTDHGRKDSISWWPNELQAETCSARRGSGDGGPRTRQSGCKVWTCSCFHKPSLLQAGCGNSCNYFS